MLIPILEQDCAISVVRASRLDDPVALCCALAAGGIRAVEFTFTTPGVEAIIAEAASVSGTLVGAGTVVDAKTAKAAVEAGARFLVTPGLSEGAARVAQEAGVPILIGALTPSEVMRGLELGAAAIKIFPAGLVGPEYISSLRGPFPGLQVVPSGGLHAGNVSGWMHAGALAVTAGSTVVSETSLSANDWDTISFQARAFVHAARSPKLESDSAPTD